MDVNRAAACRAEWHWSKGTKLRNFKEKFDLLNTKWQTSQLNSVSAHVGQNTQGLKGTLPFEHG